MITFYKYQGTGNDFIMVDDRENIFPANDQPLIERLCNRRFGIGADGLILLQIKADGGFYMQYFNSDGRESSMCGNGGRCFARFLIDLKLASGPIVFDAIDGVHEATEVVLPDGSQGISLRMAEVSACSQLFAGVYELNTGSPHHVTFIESPVASLDLLKEAHAIRYSKEYADQGINVNFVNLDGLKNLRMRTYERGVEDETLSCGTGATAAALSAAPFLGLPEGRHKMGVEVPGGFLQVSFLYRKDGPSFTEVWLTGPARFVFQGTFSH